MFTFLRKIYDWMGSWVHTTYATPILAFLFYLEAIFFLPTDPMLVLYCVERKDKAIRFATIATIASVLGGITSYFLGMWLWQAYGQSILHSPYVNYILTPETFEKVRAMYKEYDWIAILVAGFTPIPYKAATLSAGFCQLAFFPFLLCSIIARGARFFMVAGLMNLFGDHIKNIIDRHFNVIALVTIALIVVLFWTFT